MVVVGLLAVRAGDPRPYLLLLFIFLSSISPMFIDTSTWPLEVASLHIISNRKKGAAVVCDGDSDSDEESPEGTMNLDARSAGPPSFSFALQSPRN